MTLRVLAIRVLGRTWCWQLPMVAVAVLVLGEAYMRLPFVTHQLEYEPDHELGGRLAPNQRGYVWLANMSMQSPTITLNHEGHRGGTTDWTKPVLLVVGDSEWFGAGVGDEAVWTRVLEGDLRRRQGLEDLQIVNACHPGHGAYQQFVVAQRALRAHRVRAIVARVSIAQKNFRPIPLAERTKRFHRARIRQRIRRITKFLPFLFNKLEAQEESIREAFIPHVLRRPGSGSDWRTATAAEAMSDEYHAWWERLVTLRDADRIPIIFVVHDVEGLPASEVLKERLRRLAMSHRNVHVFGFGPERFGLDLSDPEKLRRAMKDVLTLGRDPHGNARQHQLLARAMVAELDREGLVEQLRTNSARRPPR